MDPILFKEKIKHIGYIKRRDPGIAKNAAYEDTLLVVNQATPSCPDCTTGPVRRLVYEQRYIRNKLMWRTRCLFCKETWPGLIL